MTDEFTLWKASQARPWCEHISRARARIDSLNAENAALLASYDGLKATCYDGDKVKGGVPSDKVGELVMRINDGIGEYASRMAALVDEVDEFSRTLDMLDGRYASVLSYRYVSRMSWDRIADRMHYAAKYAADELHRDALAALYDVMPAEYRTRIPRADG